jgi:serine phosphatase RsbU (regulator of sigma subunit)
MDRQIDSPVIATSRATGRTDQGIVAVLDALSVLPADDLGALLAIAVPGLGWAGSATVFLSDYQESMLTALDAEARGGDGLSLTVDGSLAGRAFLTQQPVVDAAGLERWMPLTNRWRRLGVLRLVVLAGQEAGAADGQGEAERMASLLATVIDSAARCTDAFYRAKRREEVSLTAEMQWELLPPMCIAGAGVTLAGRLEPAYDVGGDSFDYAINASTAHLGIFDPLGHDLRSALLATLAVGAYRHARRSEVPLGQISPLIDAAIVAQFPDGCFVTGQLAELDLRTGALSWVNAGHPLPLLLRDRQVHAISTGPDRPWGLRYGQVTVGEQSLQPGDRVLFHTDGINEARSSAGESFGTERLADLLVRESLAEHGAPELLRRILRAVVDHRSAPLLDDATAVLLEWHGPQEVLSPDG